MSGPPPAVGVADGVPYVVSAPVSGRPDAPVVLAWHALDPPRSEASLAAALPLSGLDAWRICLGLPSTGRRLPEGGFDELLRRAHEDAVLGLHGPIASAGLREASTAYACLRTRFGIDRHAPLALAGASLGAAIAALATLESGLAPAAVVLISPVVQLRRVVDAMSARFGVTYRWSAEADAIADRIDFVARAAELAPTDLLAVVGADDDVAGFRDPAAALCDAVTAADGCATLATIDGMGHAFAEEPGLEPAPPTDSARYIDHVVTDWLRPRLG